MAPLNEKTALVTGAAKRLGRAIALALAREGVDVVLHFRSSREEAEQAADSAREMGRKAWVLQADLADPNEAGSLVERAIAQAGPLDFLVNSASLFPGGRLLDTPSQDVHSLIDVNAVAPLYAARRFVGQGRSGAIVNLLDARIEDYDREHFAYHLSKRMLYDLTRMMALEFAPIVRVNGVAPGLVLAPEGKDIDYLESLRHTNPLHAFGAAEDVTSAVLFLLKSDFVTGQVVFVDGGRNLRGSVYGC